jgi:MerR family gold-responsive transcriptional activator of gol and ges genes
MSLPEIRKVLHRGAPERTGVIERQLHRIRAQRARLEEAERFLDHVINCEHDLLTRCDACRSYAASVSLPETAHRAPPG